MTIESKCSTANRPPVKHKRRFCSIEGCDKIVKCKGLCQRHGGRPKFCKIEGCNRQAQGNRDGMCKSHFRLTRSDNLGNESSDSGSGSDRGRLPTVAASSQVAVRTNNSESRIQASNIPSESCQMQALQGKDKLVLELLVPILRHMNQAVEVVTDTLGTLTALVNNISPESNVRQQVWTTDTGEQM